MTQQRSSSTGSTPFRLAVIRGVVVDVAAAFVYLAGGFTPDRLMPAKVVDTPAPPGGPALGFRCNHAKGICFTGTFAANGAGAALSKAQVLASGSTSAVTGRFNLAVADALTQDSTARVRGLSLRLRSTDGQEWRTGMITAPFFPVATTQRAKQRWTLQLVVANAGDPTADPSKAWPDDRRKVDAGTLTVEKIEPEADGPCRDINFDPTVARGHPPFRRPVPGGAFGGVRGVVRPAHRGGQELSARRLGSPAMSAARLQFTALQRALHWVMAICILAMLFIGVGMVSTIQPAHLMLVGIHKPLGIAILLLALLRLVVRWRSGAPPLPANMPEPMKLTAKLSHIASTR